MRFKWHDVNVLRRNFKIDPRVDPAETEFLRRHLLDGGWQLTGGEDWNLFWSSAVHPLKVFGGLSDGQLVNHFPGIAPLFYKDEMAHFLKLAGHSFHPDTFSMPWHHDALVAAMAEDPDALWIKKQKRWMAGEGMAILTEDTPIPLDEDWLVQRYISNPLLLPDNPYKHVVRSYVLLTSLDPLTAFVHQNGPVKFTSRPFSLSPEALRDPIVHLTNPPIQRMNTDTEDPVRSFDHDEYRPWLRDAGIDDRRLFERIDQMLADTLTALHAPVLALSREWSPRLDCCFELLGFDLMIDDDLNPWLLECNISPALGVRGREGSTHRAAQGRAKDPMVADMLRVLGLLAGPHRFDPLIRGEAA
jgi:tubulin polyglutamylase TTLL5